MYPHNKKYLEKVQGTNEWREKRERERQSRNIEMVNKQFQPIISRFHHHLKDNHEYQELLQKANRSVYSSSIIQMKGINNFQKLDVAVASFELISQSIPLLDSELQQEFIHCQRQLSVLKNQLIQIDFRLRAKLDMLMGNLSK